MSSEIQVITQAITDLAIVMAVGSAVAFLFYKLKQPLIIGYLIAGIIISPFTFGLISSDTTFISVFAEIGVILLLFTIGLEFPIRKLKALGRVVIGVSALEITMMLIVSWVVGTLLGWSFYDTLFLGAALASSSTTIIAKVLGDAGKISEISSIIMLGILVVEDVVVVIILAMFQNLVVVHAIAVVDLLWLIAKLVIFIGGTLIVGGFFIPKAIDRVAQTESKELLYVSLLGICFVFAIISAKLDFSAAIGAFLIGVVVARARCREEINRQIGPFQLVFGAIFFVSMGALMDIKQIVNYWLPAIVITLAVIGTKLASCGFGARLFGYNKTTSWRIGLGMVQIGEFAFIVAKTGQDLGVATNTVIISDFLLPTIGVATMITAFITPYLIKYSFRERENEFIYKHL
jgi:CPA2 family monovalent cation:H+ antiporter-2